MEFFNRQGNDPVANPVTLVQSELRQLSERERDLKERLAAAQLAIAEANSARQKLLLDGLPIMFKGRAIKAADDRVSKAETESHVLAETLAAITREREAAQQKLDVTQNQERRLDEAATVALVICEIVDAVKAFERATERLASALDGLPGRAAYTAPIVAASLRLNKVSFASEAGALITKIEGYRADVLDGCVKLNDPAPLSQARSNASLWQGEGGRAGEPRDCAAGRSGALDGPAAVRGGGPDLAVTGHGASLGQCQGVAHMPQQSQEQQKVAEITSAPA